MPGFLPGANRRMLAPVSRALTTEFHIREDLQQALESEWSRIAEPGLWWSGGDRVAMAAEARAALDCRLCAQRKAALSPYGINGPHDGPGELRPDIVDAVHRIRTDAGRLTRAWLDGVLADLTAPQYVELLGVVLSEAFVDTLALALGAPLWPLPMPQPGPPSEGPEPYAEVHSAWIPTVPPDRAEGVVAEIYQRSMYGEVSNVIRGLSLVPPEVSAQGVRGGATYRSQGLRLTRPQVELVATATSAALDCFY